MTPLHPVKALENLDFDRDNTELYDPYDLSNRRSSHIELNDEPKLVDRSQSTLHHLNLGVVLPALIVVLLTGGIASVFLVWILTHRTSTDSWHQGAFLLDEGERTDGGLRSGRLMGLTISSAASTVLSITTPILMTFYAFRIAHVWLDQVRRDESTRNGDLPTPLQYGLTVELLSASGGMSLLRSTKYLCRKSTGRAKSASMLLEAFVVALFIFVLSHTIYGIDLWLHSVTSTVLVPTEIPSNILGDYSVVQSRCPPVPDPPIYNCMYMAGYWGTGSVDDLSPGMLVASNSSDSLRAITLANASDLAVLVTTPVPQLLSFDMTTFGARASCQSVTPSCTTVGNVTCPGFPESFVVVNYGLGGTTNIDSGEGRVYIQTSNCDNCSHVISSDAVNESPDMYNANSRNMYSIWLQFIWRSSGDAPMGSPKMSDAVFASSGSNLANMLTNCSLSFYNVTLSYRNGTYISTDEVLSNTGLSEGLAGPTRLGHYAVRLIANIEGRAFSDNSSDSVMAFLSQDLARLAIGSAAVITNETQPALRQSVLREQVLGRYPFWPVVLFLALLYMYAAIALFLILGTSLVSQGSRVQAGGYGTEGKSISELELVQLRLTSPLAMAAALFPPSAPADEQVELSLQTTALDLFDEGHGEQRLRVGSRGGDDEDRALYGVWSSAMHEKECGNPDILTK